MPLVPVTAPVAPVPIGPTMPVPLVPRATLLPAVPPRLVRPELPNVPEPAVAVVAPVPVPTGPIVPPAPVLIGAAPTAPVAAPPPIFVLLEHAAIETARGTINPRNH